ncbi:exodeoxyribonuclease VII small subunit [Leucobacter albus]|uniref:Exodeoxyribonuclease 7 small subunit n=1 Tax=Leucobacter albus TaxID=272210 RepID=A0ABW3TQV1_9MICO
MTAPIEADVAALSYEQARDELIQVVSRLEQGGATLEESLQLWERGEALATRCEEWLIGARKRLEDARQGGAQGDTPSAVEAENGDVF